MYQAILDLVLITRGSCGERGEGVMGERRGGREMGGYTPQKMGATIS